MALDKALLPNLKNLDPSFLKPSYDPTGEYHIIKDFGITMFFFNNKIVTDDLKTMHDFYMAMPKYVSQGRTNLLDGPEEVVPLALMALGLDPNTTSQNDFNQVKSFLLSIRKGVTTIDSSAYINDAIAGKIILSQGWNGDVRRIVQGRAKQKDITAIIPTEALVPAALTGVAGRAIAAVLHGLLPGPDGHPGGVLTRHPAGLRRPQVRVRHLPVPADRVVPVPHHLRAHAGDGGARHRGDD